MLTWEVSAGGNGDGDGVAVGVEVGIVVCVYEMADFVANNTDFNVIVRSGGDIELIKRLLAGGFPVLVEKGYFEADYTGKVAWMGHYLFVTGYDENKGEFTVQDAYLKPGKDMKSDYQTFMDGWRSFNYLCMVVYPAEREPEVFDLLGSWADPNWANQRALETAEAEIQTRTGIDEFFAWFNKGSSLVNLLDYNGAATAYDQAFTLYSQFVCCASTRE